MMMDPSPPSLLMSSSTSTSAMTKAAPTSSTSTTTTTKTTTTLTVTSALGLHRRHIRGLLFVMVFFLFAMAWASLSEASWLLNMSPQSAVGKRVITVISPYSPASASDVDDENNSSLMKSFNDTTKETDGEKDDNKQTKGKEFQSHKEEASKNVDQTDPSDDSARDEQEKKQEEEDEEEEEDLAPFWPVRVLHQYKKDHSQQTLQKEYAHLISLPSESESSSTPGISSASSSSLLLKNNRKFAIVYYWCPERAGNIFHNMFNTMAWAIITNRTILVKYDNYSNSEDDCQSVLKRSEWLPRWEDWEPLLHLRDPVPIPALDISRIHYDALHQTVIFPQIPDLANRAAANHPNSKYSHSRTPIMTHEWRNDPLNKMDYKLYINEMANEKKIVAGKLYNNGPNFVLGMLFRETFTFQLDPISPRQVRDPVSSGLQSSSSIDDLTIALHSRHPVVGDDGSFTPDEQKCLNQLIRSSASASTRHCKIYLMSDRPKTIQTLSQWLLRHTNCTPITVAHDSYLDDNNTTGTADTSAVAVRHTEHGPYTGIGFLQELQLSSLARTAVVGDIHRSSFMLLVELIEYDRMMQAWQEGRDEIDDLQVCRLPSKEWKGYNYGPGTPTFRHHSKLEPLPPVQIIEQYKAIHSNEQLEKCYSNNVTRATHQRRRRQRQRRTLSSNNGTKESTCVDREREQKFSIVLAPCRIVDGEGDSLRQFLNGFLWSVLTNRTMLIKTLDSKTCRDFPELCQQGLPSNCDKDIPFANWIAKYADWNDALNLTSGTLVHPDDVFPKDVEHSEMTTQVPFPYDDIPVVIFPLNSNKTKMIDTSLYEQGVDFLYGMLFTHAFHLRNPPLSLSQVRTVALYSRDRLPDSPIDKFSISNEEKCLQSVHTAITAEKETGGVDSSPCQLFIMSNRKNALELLEEKVQAIGCTSHFSRRLFVNDGNEKDSAKVDSAVSPTEKYFLDLKVASTARSGFIGDHSASSDLLLALIEYQRRMEVWKQGRDPPLLPTLHKCFMNR